MQLILKACPWPPKSLSLIDIESTPFSHFARMKHVITPVMINCKRDNDDDGKNSHTIQEWGVHTQLYTPEILNQLLCNSKCIMRVFDRVIRGNTEFNATLSYGDRQICNL